ncbi:MAG: single-strand DNA-binding protein [Bacteroidales bacterium]|nr:single-strand DNA-binding protein [Bacteroidales bacterium]
MGVNKVILVGYVGKDPDVRHLDSGVSVANFSLATSETYRNKENQKVTNTEWHNIVVWRRLAEIVEKYVKKGDPLYIEGKIRTRSYDDKDGNKKYITEIFADNMQMLGSKQSNTNDSSSDEKQPETDIETPPQEEDDLPF